MPFAFPSPFSSVIALAPFSLASAPECSSCPTLCAHPASQTNATNGASLPIITTLLSHFVNSYKPSRREHDGAFELVRRRVDGRRTRVLSARRDEGPADAVDLHVHRR